MNIVHSTDFQFNWTTKHKVEGRTNGEFSLLRKISFGDEVQSYIILKNSEPDIINKKLNKKQKFYLFTLSILLIVILILCYVFINNITELVKSNKKKKIRYSCTIFITL